MDKKELTKKLILLDEEISMVLPNSEHIALTIVGGGALILQDYLNRITLDIDLIDVYSNELVPIFEKYDVNIRSNAFCDCMAENYAQRLKKLDIKTRSIDYYVLSLEDLVIMKLFSDRGKDRDDIRKEEVIKSIDWDLLNKIISDGEADNSFNERRYKDFLYKYNEYIKEYKK